MQELDFTLELNSEHLPQELEYNLFAEAETQLKELAKDHSDMTGAAISVKQVKSSETGPFHEVTVTVYSRPEHIAATEQGADPHLVLGDALGAVERQIRQRREKLKKRWQRPGNLPTEQDIQKILAAESAEKAKTNE